MKTTTILKEEIQKRREIFQDNLNQIKKNKEYIDRNELNDIQNMDLKIYWNARKSITTYQVKVSRMKQILRDLEELEIEINQSYDNMKKAVDEHNEYVDEWKTYLRDFPELCAVPEQED